MGMGQCVRADGRIMNLDWGKRVAGYGVRGAGCGLRVASCGVRGAGCEVRGAGYELRVTGYEKFGGRNAEVGIKKHRAEGMGHGEQNRTI
jgi:hypothetical protein